MYLYLWLVNLCSFSYVRVLSLKLAFRFLCQHINNKGSSYCCHYYFHVCIILVTYVMYFPLCPYAV